MDFSVALALLLFAAGSLAGLTGALLGLGGGIFMVPFLAMGLHLPMQAAVGISLATVIATSSVVSAGTAGRRLINVRLGMVLEIATAAGAILGAWLAGMLSETTLRTLFALVTTASGVAILRRVNRSNVVAAGTDPGTLGGRLEEGPSGAEVVYRVRRLPVGLAVSFVAGSVSTLLGIGGGILKVPALTAWCGVPLRASAATSAFMIGVTATAGAVIYFARGDIVPWMAAASVLGVLAGSQSGLRIGARARTRDLKLLMAVVLFLVSFLMLARAFA
ncbi:MAG: sulfite exporter TauE/SafE family protein [Vicinamibacterales bacterium]